MGKLLIICGATATGKSALAVECAKKLSTEIISADSQLIYRGLNIGTAKPTPAEMQGIKHSMIDIVPPTQEFSVSDYEQLARPHVTRLLSEGKTPIVCGGTGFYINSLLYKMGYGNSAADKSVRAKYEVYLAEHGKDALFAKLCEVDRESAEKLHPNDVKRVIRALEIYELSGKKKSEQHDELKPLYDYTAVTIEFPRAQLYERIDCRVDIMFNSGLVDEVKRLLSSGVPENCRALQAIGYKEVVECLKNGDNESTMRDIIKRNTRHYAKRQITFFKKMKGVVRLDCREATVDNVLRLL